VKLLFLVILPQVPKIIFILLLALALTAQAQQPRDTQAIQELAHADDLRRVGDAAQAKKIYESLVARLRPLGPSPILGTAILHLSEFALASGDYDQAIAISRDAIAVYEKCDNRDGKAQDGQALAHGNIGLAHMNAGRYPEAAAEMETSLRLFTTNSIAADNDIVNTWNNLGNVYYYQAKYTEALRAYEAAMRYVEKSRAEPWAPQWRQYTRFNLATLYQRLGNYQRALDIYKDIETSLQGLTPAEIAHLYANMGVLFRRLGDGYKALDTYHKAERQYAAEKDADGELGVQKNIGIVLAFELGRSQEALRQFDQALALARKSGNQREELQLLFYRGRTLFDAGRFPEAGKEFTAALAFAENLNTVEEQWNCTYWLGRVADRTGHPDVAEARFREAIGKIETLRSKLQLNRLKSDFLADKRDVYDELIRLLVARNDSAGAFEFLERSRARVFQDRFATETGGALTLAATQQRLPSDTALIEFWAGPEDLAAIWVTRSGTGIVQSKLSRDDRNAMIGLIAGLPDSLGTDWKAGFHKLAGLLPQGIAPLDDAQYKHLLIVPDGYLSLVPFELLANAKGEPLIENHDITYLPSAVLLSRSVPARAGLRFPWQRQLRAFGDPMVIGHGESPLITGARDEIAGNLPWSGDEIRAIARMSHGRADLYLGANDSKGLFFAPSGTPLLHVSTHAVADLDNPERSRLLFSPDTAGDTNNYVFLKELYDLDLRGVDLATLSACDTERGRLLPGEGIQAFSRALLSAGSKSTVTTLWRVPDQPTAEFMKQFYYFLLTQNKPKAEALRLAKLQFLHSGTALSHPNYWAAFVLNGEGSEPAPRFLSWYVLVAPLVLLMIGVWWYLIKIKSKTFAPRSHGVAEKNKR